MTQRQGLDPITRNIIKNYLESAADTMAVTVVRTARSLVVRDNMDFSTAIFNAEGDQVAQGLTLPFHMGAMQPALDAVRKHFAGDIQPGDIFANNDPYEGASHLPDIFLFKPIFVNDLLMGWTCVIAHQTDIGGRVAGGNACDNTEIYQEGLRLPPIKLYERGQLNKAVWRIIEKNVRVPDKVLGDIQAQLSAIRQGEKEVLRLVSDHGLENLKNYMTDIIDYTERLTRADISSLPNGTWDFTDYVDDDGFSDDPIAIKLKLTIEEDEILLDFTGTSPQAKGSINPNFPFTKSAACAALKNLTNPGIAANAGFFRPIKVIAPPGCYVNPQHPAPVAARGLGGFRVAHTVFGAMAKALPGKVPAAWGGGEIGASFGGYYPDGQAFVFLEFNNDGPRGGGPYADGPDGATAPVTNQSNTPIESIEADQPLRITRYSYIPDSGGAGKFRGGLGVIREYELTADEASLQIRSDRNKFLPWGTQGGNPGTQTHSFLNPDRENRELPSKFMMDVQKGDVYRSVQAGAGGYGDPLERDPSAVLNDILQEKVTISGATEYGVVVDSESLEIDVEATNALRNDIRGTRGELSMEPHVIKASERLSNSARVR